LNQFENQINFRKEREKMVKKRKRKLGKSRSGCGCKAVRYFCQSFTGKTPGIKKDTCPGLADVPVQGSAGRTANLGLLFDFDGSINLKKGW
jgi:hypothetical protein